MTSPDRLTIDEIANDIKHLHECVEDSGDHIAALEQPADAIRENERLCAAVSAVAILCVRPQAMETYKALGGLCEKALSNKDREERGAENPTDAQEYEAGRTDSVTQNSVCPKCNGTGNEYKENKMVGWWTICSCRTQTKTS